MAKPAGNGSTDDAPACGIKIYCMNTIPVQSQIWSDVNFEHLFLLPDAMELPAGVDTIHNLDGETKLVSIVQLASYACTREEAAIFLRGEWDRQVEASKKAWNRLYEFSNNTGAAYDPEALKNDFLQGFMASGEGAQQSFDAGKNIVEQLLQAAQGDTGASEAEQQEAFKKLFKNVPDLLSKFNAENLDAAALDPEKWANDMYQQAFGEQEKAKHKAAQDKLAKEIQASIAAGLRKAGIKPSDDFDKK